MARVTVVNDNPEFLELMKEVLEAEGHEATTIEHGGGDVPERIDASAPDLVLLDVRMAADELQGWQLTMAVRQRAGMEHVPILLCSADLQALRELETRVTDHPAIGLMAKPFGIDQLTDNVKRLLSGSARR